MKPGASETLDSIKDVKLFQSKKGYRFSIDAVLLEDFISAKKLGKGAELGAGSGVISILLAKRMQGARIQQLSCRKPLLSGRCEM